MILETQTSKNHIIHVFSIAENEFSEHYGSNIICIDLCIHILHIYMHMYIFIYILTDIYIHILCSFS
jgi:hypothetical protein